MQVVSQRARTLEEAAFIATERELAQAARDRLKALELKLGRQLSTDELGILEFQGCRSLAEWTVVEAEMALLLHDWVYTHWISRLQMGSFTIGMYAGGAELASPVGLWLRFAGTASLLTLLSIMFLDVAEIDIRLMILGYLAFYGNLLLEFHLALRRVRTHLPASDVLDSLVDGSPRFNQVASHIPLPWRWVAARHHGTLGADLRAAVDYLPWLVRPTRICFLLRWILVPFNIMITMLHLIMRRRYSIPLDAFCMGLNGALFSTCCADYLLLQLQDRVRKRLG